MILTAHEKWLFGSFLIFARNQFVARKAYEILSMERDSTRRAGVLNLNTGETARWMNLDLPFNQDRLK